MRRSKKFSANDSAPGAGWNPISRIKNSASLSRFSISSARVNPSLSPFPSKQDSYIKSCCCPPIRTSSQIDCRVVCQGAVGTCIVCIPCSRRCGRLPVGSLGGAWWWSPLLVFAYLLAASSFNLLPHRRWRSLFPAFRRQAHNKRRRIMRAWKAFVQVYP